MIPNKALFGSDGPSLPVERWLGEVADLGLKPEVPEKIMLENAKKVFDLEPA